MIKSIAVLGDIAPGIMMCFLIARGGLLYTAVGFMLEVALLFMRKLNAIGFGVHRWIMLPLSSVGIAAGAALFPVRSMPQSLGIAAIFITIVIHGVLFITLSGFTEKR